LEALLTFWFLKWSTSFERTRKSGVWEQIQGISFYKKVIQVLLHGQANCLALRHTFNRIGQSVVAVAGSLDSQK
jgi:hypothetical protein